MTRARRRGPFRRVAATALVGALTTWGAAAEQRLEFAPETTRVSFAVGATLHTVRGSAQILPSSLRFDAEAGTCAGAVVVDATSLESGNARRDRVMHAKVLESEQFPRMALVCETFDGALGGELRVQGAFELQGERHPVDVVLTSEREGEVLVLRGSFDVPYVLWGLKDPSKPLLRVKKVVQVSLEARAALEDG